MSKKPETLFKEKVVRRLKPLVDAGLVWHVKTQQLAIVGTPDMLFCVNGRFIAWELKATAKGKASPLQLHNLAAINRAMGLGLVVHPDNFELCYEILEKWARGFSVPDSLLATARA